MKKLYEPPITNEIKPIISEVQVLVENKKLVKIPKKKLVY